MEQSQKLLGTASEVIDALGGTNAIAEMLGVRPSAVSNYRKQGFPAKAHFRLAQVARQAGLNVAGIVFGGIIPDATDLPAATTTPINFFIEKGFEKIETPTLQPATPYINLLGEEMRSRLYSFTAPDGEKLCLRPDLTVPTALAYIASGRKTRSLFCYEGLAYRYQRQDQTSEGRAREFIQTGIELLGGKKSIDDDALILRTILNAIEQAGVIDYKIKVNNLTLFYAFLQSINIEKSQTRYINRFYTYGYDMEDVISDEPQLQDFINLAGTPKQVIAAAERLAINAKQNLQLHADYWEDLVKRIGIAEKDLIFDIKQGRKMSYYTNLNFEIFTPTLGDTLPIATGGRYNNLLRELGGGADIPAVGGAIFRDRLDMAKRKEKL